jgi:hypothetical protein
MAKCESHHICECQAAKLKTLQKENKELKKQVAKYEKLLEGVKYLEQVDKVVRQVGELIGDVCPYIEH